MMRPVLERALLSLVAAEQALVQVRVDWVRGRPAAQAHAGALLIAQANLERAQRALSEVLVSGQLVALPPCQLKGE